MCLIEANSSLEGQSMTSKSRPQMDNGSKWTKFGDLQLLRPTEIFYHVWRLESLVVSPYFWNGSSHRQISPQVAFRSPQQLHQHRPQRLQQWHFWHQPSSSHFLSLAIMRGDKAGRQGSSSTTTTTSSTKAGIITRLGDKAAGAAKAAIMDPLHWEVRASI